MREKPAAKKRRDNDERRSVVRDIAEDVHSSPQEMADRHVAESVRKHSNELRAAWLNWTKLRDAQA